MTQLFPLSRQPEPPRGQALALVALLMVVLLLFTGLGIDVGYVFARRAKLQSAVDASALSAAQMLVGAPQTDPTTKAHQMMEANDIQLTSLAQPLEVTFPGPRQVGVAAIQRVDTFFIRLIPAFETINVSAAAVADLNNYAEILAKPFGKPGVVSELNLMVWGSASHRRNGDAYSPTNIGAGNVSPNPWHGEQPWGYLFRIDVPASYPSNRMVLQIFDPDSYNRPGAPPAYSAPYDNPDEFASCANTRTGECTSNGTDDDPAMKLNGYGTSRPAFWRVDEYRRPYTAANGGEYNPAFETTTRYTLWHFDPRITSAFEDPATLTDSPTGQPIATFQVKGNEYGSDLSWVQPVGFDLTLSDYERESTGGWYFYLYVQGVGGSSENNYDLRVGPPSPTNYHCPLDVTSRDPFCYVNRLYYHQAMVDPTQADWETGGAIIFAKRALPLNLDTGDAFPLVFTQVTKRAEGQTIGVRHFDQDCNRGCGTPMRYQMQICGCALPFDNDACWTDVAPGWVGPNDGWSYSIYPDPEPVTIPAEGSALYNVIFGDGLIQNCESSWLRLFRHPSYSQDTTVWEMPFIRPRLIR